MTTEIKDGDLYSYANVYVESHGFLIRTNEDFMYEVRVDPILGVELLIGTCESGTLNFHVQPSDIDKLIYDRRLDHVLRSHIMVYRSGKSKEEVLKMIQPQLREVLEQRRKAFEELVFNVEEMLIVVDENSTRFTGDFLCSTVPGNKQTA